MVCCPSFHLHIVHESGLLNMFIQTVTMISLIVCLYLLFSNLNLTISIYGNPPYQDEKPFSEEVNVKAWRQNINSDHSGVDETVG